MTLKAKGSPMSTSNERLWEQVKLSLSCLHAEIILTYDFTEEPLYVHLMVVAVFTVKLKQCEIHIWICIPQCFTGSSKF